MSLPPLCRVLCRLPSFPCSGRGGKRQRGVSSGEVANPDKFPAGDDERGVLLIVCKLACLLGSLALAVSAAFAADGAQGGGVPTTF